MAKLKITETVLRDAHQSLLATRMSMDDMRPILSTMDKIGFYSAECWGGIRLGERDNFASACVAGEAEKDICG